MAKEEISKTTYFSKNEIQCPVCETKFKREELLTGRGRLIAGDLTEELRRIYEPSQKYGEVYPIIYSVTVCPQCFYGAYQEDFNNVPEKIIFPLKEGEKQRQTTIKRIFPEISFKKPRDLESGIAAYLAAMLSYDMFPKNFSPTIKEGISSLRAAWLCDDLHRKYPKDNYDYLEDIFYRKARFFYTMAIEYESDGTEGIAEASNLGPDLDKNFSYDGVLYLGAYLELKYGQTKDHDKRKQSLQFAKKALSRIFGLGKASRNKPAVLLDMSKDLFNLINEEIKKYEQ